ncbi:MULTISPECIES: CBS domain-containing protein [unclassified Bacillus (in: firmicutes)]|uniref:CBS domain-containing protein n=1 Tax=unclassified Bacillus (in: firmicutes) TaxID=185979 RepID=UPI0008E62195|nr:MULTISPECIES: CBS domain-containing protein [unclassified Bacillus (in: firmicutes)]SFB08254.1 hypothetical protein SAMN02799634_105161 [Bacillus sp. UNCCL13]SFQ87125.1 hypothetical protein SAMN04488577_2960 [Bacillus sp. cl95]
MLESTESVKEIQKQREKSERFEIAFNQIHTELRKLVKLEDSDHFLDLLHKAKNRHASIRNFFDDLKSYARLRNALVHEKSRENFYIAEPHLEVVERIENISQFLQSPPSVLSIASGRVKTYDAFEEVKDFLEDTKDDPYSQFPIYRGNKFVFLLTEGGLRSFFAEKINGHTIDLKGIKVFDLQSYEKERNVQFITPNQNVFDLEDLFEGRVQDGNKLEAVIVTPNGSKEEKPVGIITPWDLIKMDT